MSKKTGFTLVELLAVIVILAIILVIAVPGISGLIQSSTRGAFESDAKMVLKAVEYKLLEDSSFDPSTVNETNVNTLLNLDNSNYQTLTIKEINGTYHVTIVGKNKWSNLTVAGTPTSTRVDDTVTTYSNGANKPVLATGMTPIKWNGSAWVDTTESDSSWYNYDTTSKQWANARTADGSMWVWIPRYIYNISSGWHSDTAGTIDIQFTKGVDDNWNKAVIGNIDLGETASASNNKWTNHPAFTFGDTELTGIWVAKFEVSGTASAVDIKPNVTALRYTNVGNIFTAARNMETNSRYGWGTTGNGIDTHLIKNTEWGAVAYLFQSTYGKNADIWLNTSTTYITGCAGDSVADNGYSGCKNTYNTANGQQASTTGNIYGIYDLSGGSWEYTASYVDNGSNYLTTYGNNILDSNAKYKNVYVKSTTDSQANNYDLAISSKGDAIYETSASGSGADAWYIDFGYMPYSDNPWFGRGNGANAGYCAGVFNFNIITGGSLDYLSFRPVLLVGVGL